MSQLSQFIVNHWPLVAGLLIVVVLIIINELASRKHQAQKLSPQGLVHQMNHNDVPVYDLRPVEVYREGHIVNAARVQKDEFDKEPLKNLINKPFVLVCDSGTASTTLANALKQKGFEQVMVLQGGMRAWQETDLPLIKGK